MAARRSVTRFVEAINDVCRSSVAPLLRCFYSRDRARNYKVYTLKRERVNTAVAQLRFISRFRRCRSLNGPPKTTAFRNRRDRRKFANKSPRVSPTNGVDRAFLISFIRPDVCCSIFRPVSWPALFTVNLWSSVDKSVRRGGQWKLEFLGSLLTELLFLFKGSLKYF